MHNVLCIKVMSLRKFKAALPLFFYCIVFKGKPRPERVKGNVAEAAKSAMDSKF